MFEIVTASGRRKSFGCYEAAKDAAMGWWPSCVIGHAGDLSDGGDRTLIWETEDAASSDAGVLAIAKIAKI